ncbi:hypothetical protein EDF62_2985, partial [Leucobacter luti]
MKSGICSGDAENVQRWPRGVHFGPRADLALPGAARSYFVLPGSMLPCAALPCSDLDCPVSCPLLRCGWVCGVWARPGCGGVGVFWWAFGVWVVGVGWVVWCGGFVKSGGFMRGRARDV